MLNTIWGVRHIVLNSRRNSLALLEPTKVKKDMDQFRRVPRKMMRIFRGLFKRGKKKKLIIKGWRSWIFFQYRECRTKVSWYSFQIHKRPLQRGREYMHGLSQGDQWDTDLNYRKEDLGYTSGKKKQNLSQLGRWSFGTDSLGKMWGFHYLRFQEQVLSIWGNRAGAWGTLRVVMHTNLMHGVKQFIVLEFLEMCL